MIEYRKREYRRLCACIEDLVKLKECEDCPHYNGQVIKLEDSCTYSCDKE